MRSSRKPSGALKLRLVLDILRDGRRLAVNGVGLVLHAHAESRYQRLATPTRRRQLTEKCRSRSPRGTRGTERQSVTRANLGSDALPTAMSSSRIASALMLGMKKKVMAAETIARPEPIQKTPCDWIRSVELTPGYPS
jgi:hypothetical protein